MLREEFRGVDEIAAKTCASPKGHGIVAKALAEGVERDGEVALVARHGAPFIDSAKEVSLNPMGVGPKIAHTHAGEADMHALGPNRGQQIACNRSEYVLIVGRVCELALDRPTFAKGLLKLERDGSSRQSTPAEPGTHRFGEQLYRRLDVAGVGEVVREGPLVTD